MSKFKSIYAEIIKVVTTKVTIVVLSFCGLGISQIWSYYKLANNESRIVFLESNFDQEVGVRMEITKLLSNCPTYTGLAWIEYNKNTGKILFKKVLTYDETIGIYDATTTNDLYSSSLIDRKSLHYFANLEEGEVYFITEKDSMWEEYGFFAKTRAHAWKFTNQKIKEYSKADYLKKIIREHGSEGIKVLRLYNVVIKDKNRNLIYILSIGLSGKSDACYNGNKAMTRTQLLDLSAYIRDITHIT